jgi:GT2 family glycosyltransferase
VFLDGDCVAPPDHVVQHLKYRQPRMALAGFCYHLDAVTSARIDDEAVRTGAYQNWVPPELKKKLDRMDRKSRFYALVRHPRRPKLYSGNFGIWRSDYEAVNGFNEDFMGWGCEDDDFGLRVLRSGVRVRSILRWTRTYHLWHPPVPSNPRRWRDGSNVQRLRRENRRPSARCVHGLRNLADVA